MLGEALIADMARPSGRVLVSHLGVGLADVVFGRAILEAAVERRLGTMLTPMKLTDLIVAGAGTMGAWTALLALRAGRRVLPRRLRRR